MVGRAVLIGLIVAACGSSSSLQVSGQQQIRHVFIITLDNENYATTFGANSKAPYLSQTLASQGAMVPQYYGTEHVSLDNYISMIRGQAPTNDTDNDCITYSDDKLTGVTADGFQLDHIGYAGLVGLVGFGSDIFTNL